MKPAHRFARRFPLFHLLLLALVFSLVMGGPSAAAQPPPGIPTPPAEAPSLPELAPPPTLPEQPEEPLLPPANTAAPAGMQVAICSQPGCIHLPLIFLQQISVGRASALSLYRDLYLSGEDVQPGWNGSVNNCQPGTTSAAFKTAILNRLNYFRRAAGVPPLSGLDVALNQKAQAAALMMSKQGALSHSPGEGWGCYTAAGAEAAGKSNLYLGNYGPSAIAGYMRDPGANNKAVGHRRWILYPQTTAMGAGDIPASAGFRPAQALWVITAEYSLPRPPTRAPYVAWPPAGYIPYPVVYARWSFSYPQADFSQATVSLSQGATPVPVTREAPVNGYGENTLVWMINGMNDSSPWPRPAGDTPYTVTVQGVRINGQPQNFTYTVIVFDPD